MDAYERALFNCQARHAERQGLKQYFFPLAAGYWRAYNSPEESFWCCTGTGAEEFAKFADTIYFRRGSDIYVNQFIASTLDWKEQGIVLEQVTQFPREQGTTLKIKTPQPTTRTIHLRIPSWTTEDAQVKINGRPIEAMADPGSYLALRKIWKDGDTITLSLPMELRQESLPGEGSAVAALYGPLVLAANLGAGPPDGPMRIVHGRPYGARGYSHTRSARRRWRLQPDSDVKQWIQIESPAELRFAVTGEKARYQMLPMYQVGDQRYSVYWKMNDSRNTPKRRTDREAKLEPKLAIGKQSDETPRIVVLAASRRTSQTASAFA